MSKSDRIQKEQSFHDIRFQGDYDIREGVDKYYTVNKHLKKRYLEIVSANCKDKKLLEYGCAKGDETIQLISFGAFVTGIDISPIAIKRARENVVSKGYSSEYFVMDAEHTEFPDNSFDIVVGSGILHHLDLKNAYTELSRIVKPEGRIVFMEPLGHNLFIRLYRWLTPKIRTQDEHPIKTIDLLCLKEYFHNVETDFFTMFTLLAVPFRNQNYFNKLLDFLRKVDKSFFYFPFIRKHAWMVIIHAYNPRK